MSDEPNPWAQSNSPVTPHGISGLRLELQNFIGDAAFVDPGHLSKSMLMALCGGEDWLKQNFPRYGKPRYSYEGQLLGFDQLDFDQAGAARALIIACCDAAKAARQ